MKKFSLLILSLLLGLILPGCVKTYTFQAEREDQVLEGNRGYIMGEAPKSEVERKQTRTMMGVDVELPASKEYKKRKKALTEERVTTEKTTGETAVYEEPERGFTDEQWTGKKEVKEEGGTEPVLSQQYTVKEGDTLQKIAKKFLGRTSKWTKIYEANKDSLKDPSRIYPGQVIMIPGTTFEEKNPISETK
jgi:nucleoid-associated protein YgaU